MKNIGASVGAVPAHEKKEAEVKKVVEEGKKYIRKENEVIFCLDEAPEYRISAVARWGENARREILDQPDIYFVTFRQADYARVYMHVSVTRYTTSLRRKNGTLSHFVFT